MDAEGAEVDECQADMVDEVELLAEEFLCRLEKRKVKKSK